MSQLPAGGRAGGAVVQRRRRSGEGQQGANHSLYLSHQVWADLEALAAAIGWSVARTADGLLALTMEQHSAARRLDPGAAIPYAELRELAQCIVAFDMGLEGAG